MKKKKEEKRWKRIVLLKDTILAFYKNLPEVRSCKAEKPIIVIIQWNSVSTYPQGKWKKVRTNRSTFYPKWDSPHWQDRFHVFTRTICHGRCFSTLNVVHYSLFVQWNSLSGHPEHETCREIEIKLKGSGWHARDQKKELKKGQKSAPGGKIGT